MLLICDWLNSLVIESDRNEHTVRRSTMVSRNMERKGLRNITNLPQQCMPLSVKEKSKLKAASTEECINKLNKVCFQWT